MQIITWAQMEKAKRAKRYYWIKVVLVCALLLAAILLVGYGEQSALKNNLY